MILAGIGRYGPYVQHGGTYANLPDAEEVFDIGLNRAVTVLAEKRAGAGLGRGRAAAAPLKELGPHPTSGEPVRVLSGKYGPYITSSGINANVPKGSDPLDVTLDQAVALLAERAAKSPGPRRGGRPAKSGAKAKPAKRATAKAKTSTAKPKPKPKPAAKA